VKGHAGDEGNERADELARLGAEESAVRPVR
jgi:ribonuclease HI